MTLARVIQLVGIVMAGMASATDYPATWALADHGTVPAATVYAITDSSNDAQLPGTMSSGDVNGDGSNDFAYEFPVGTFNVHFGGISADLDLDSNSYSGSNGFSIVTGNSGHIWGTIAGDVNQDGFNDVLFFHEASASVKIVFGKASGWSASYTVASMTWDGTDGRELTYTGESNFADSSFGGSTPQILSGFDINNDGIDDIAVVSKGSSNSGRVSIFFGKSTWSASVDGSTDFDGTSTGFSFMDAANARLGRGLTVGDVNGDGIDDVVAASGTYSASIADIYAHVDGTTGFRLCGAATNTYIADYYVTSTDFNGDGISDLLFAGRGSQQGLYLLFGKASFAASLTLPFASGEGVSFTGFSAQPAFLKIANLGKFNNDQYEDMAFGDGSSLYVVFGSDTIDVTALSGSDGFKVTDGGGGSFNSPFYSPIDMTGDGSTDVALFISTLLMPSFVTVNSPYAIVGNGPAGGASNNAATSTTSSSLSTSATTSSSTETSSSTFTHTSSSSSTSSSMTFSSTSFAETSSNTFTGTSSSSSTSRSITFSSTSLSETSSSTLTRTSQTTTSDGNSSFETGDEATTTAEVVSGEQQTDLLDDEDNGVNGWVVFLIVMTVLIMIGCGVVVSCWIVRRRDRKAQVTHEQETTNAAAAASLSSTRCQVGTAW
ncbi:unnamed protein product [Symbiodinium sp. CCMP2456]|nr:unnamed protein product [Symbiodinium sp. CCMP2456]